jgi:hypothetical protein
MLAVTTDSESNQPGRLAHDGPAHYGRPEAPQTTVVTGRVHPPLHDADGAGHPDRCPPARAVRAGPLFVSAVYRAGMTWLSVRGAAGLAVPASSRFPRISQHPRCPPRGWN